jgi:hypothetical protein
MNRALVIALSLLAGCTLFPSDNSERMHTSTGGGSNDGGSGGGDGGLDGCGGSGPQIQLLTPFTLACQSFPTSSACDPSTCDSCPDLDAGAIILPNWASCQSSCLAQTEQACALMPGCRVTEEANRYYGVSTGDPFLGCFPDNLGPSSSELSCQFLDADSCTSSSSCWAVYDAPDGVQCGIQHAEACASGTFVACVDAGATVPGRCGPDQTITCSTPMPVCPSGTQPGINDNCYTGICIPSHYCSALPF